MPSAVWRLLTSAVFHMGILHVAFNMMAFVPIGQSLERLIGTVQVRIKPARAVFALAAAPSLVSTGRSPMLIWVPTAWPPL